MRSSKVRAIGVPNLVIPLLRALAPDQRVEMAPATNEVELYPYFSLESRHAYAEEKGMRGWRKVRSTGACSTGSL
jgi:diketogulonate reductase-like aldo/keto reductase